MAFVNLLLMSDLFHHTSVMVTVAVIKCSKFSDVFILKLKAHKISTKNKHHGLLKGTKLIADA